MATELVVDSSVAVRAAGSTQGAKVLRRFDLVAPPLLWSEVTSAVNEAAWRGEIAPHQHEELVASFDALSIRRVRPTGLYRDAADLARQLGWAKTYDAEFLALAKRRGCRVVTADSRLARGAARTGLVLPLAELGGSWPD